MKKIWQLIIIIPILIGVVIGIYISIRKQVQISSNNSKIESVFGSVSSKTAKITKYYSFGTSLNIEGKIEGISKDNFEGIKILVTDGADYNEYYDVENYFEDGVLYFNTIYINDSIDLENLEIRKLLCFGKIKIK